MLRTVYTPNSDHISVPIPDKYIGTELEILVFPINEVSTSKIEKKAPDTDVSFGGWADMDKISEEYIPLDEFKKLVHEDTEKFCKKHGIN